MVFLNVRFFAVKKLQTICSCIFSKILNKLKQFLSFIKPVCTISMQALSDESDLEVKGFILWSRFSVGLVREPTQPTHHKRCAVRY